MEDVDIARLKATIQTALASQERSARAVSLEAGMGPDTLGKFLKGETGSLRADNLGRVLRALKLTESAFGAVSTMPAHGVQYGGIVEAGAFRRNDPFDQEAEVRRVPLPPDPRYPAAAQYAFRVEGDSMTEARIFEGMHVLAVDVHTWERLHGEPGDGKLVIVARHRNGEAERELTVKRLRLFRDRMELRPESRNPVHQPLVFPLPPRQDEDAEAQIIAVVLSATWILA